jgi:XTP/dITP diphosphohydrolase
LNLRLPRLVVATGNAGKLREFRALLAGVAAEVVSQADLGIPSVAETETSFVGNALLKARHAARAAGTAALADDSGLEVDALEGAPGVYSARYAGEGADDAANNAKLLRALAAVPAPRRARYRAVLVLVRHADDPDPVIAEGAWEGSIALAPQGGGGFGYDPLFLVGSGPLTAAELPAEVKNRQSHRAMALSLLLARLQAT